MSEAKRDEERPYVVRLVEDRWTTWRHVVEAVAIVAAGLWAFYTFVYQEDIKPAGEPAALTPTISMQRLGRDAKRDILSVRVRLHNTGKTELDIAADALNVYGVRYGTKPLARTRSRGTQVVKTTYELPIVSRRVVLRQYELRAMAKGGIPGFHIVLEPDATADLPEIVAVPRGAYDALEVEAIVVPLKTSVKQPVEVGVGRDSDGGYTLIPDAAAGAFEDNTETSFALIP